MGLCHYIVEPIPTQHSSTSRFLVCCGRALVRGGLVRPYPIRKSYFLKHNMGKDTEVLSPPLRVCLLTAVFSVYFKSPAFFIAFFKSSSDILPEARAETTESTEGARTDFALRCACSS